MCDDKTRHYPNCMMRVACDSRNWREPCCSLQCKYDTPHPTPHTLTSNLCDLNPTTWKSIPKTTRHRTINHEAPKTGTSPADPSPPSQKQRTPKPEPGTSTPIPNPQSSSPNTISASLNPKPSATKLFHTQKTRTCTPEPYAEGTFTLSPKG